MKLKYFWRGQKRDNDPLLMGVKSITYMALISPLSSVLLPGIFIFYTVAFVNIITIGNRVKHF